MYINFVYVITVVISKMSKNRWVVHYQNIFITNNNKLIEVTNERYEKLINAKKARRTLVGCHLHPDQCDIIPDVFVPGLNYHPECYKHFIRAVSELKTLETLYHLLDRPQQELIIPNTDLDKAVN